MTVPYGKHKVRPHKEVRARVRAGTHPSQADEPRHKKRRGGKKPWKVEGRAGGGWWGGWWTSGRYTTEARARAAFKTLKRKHWPPRVRLVDPDGNVLEEGGGG